MMKLQAAVVGSETLLGREVRDVAAEERPDVKLKLLGIETGGGLFTEEDGEASLILGLQPDSLSGIRLAWLCGDAASSRQAFDLAALQTPAPVLIDLTSTLEDQAGARLRAPWLEAAEERDQLALLHVVAHPAALALGLFFERLAARYPVRRSVVQVLEPASERGRAGIDELQQQTIGLLSFRTFERRVFDAQLGFNLLARYGSHAPLKLEECEQRIDRHLASLLSRRARLPMPSLRLAQAPVFHGYTISAWVEFDEIPEAGELAGALACPGVEVRAAGEAPPNNVEAAGQSGIVVGAIEPDRNSPRAAWFWLVADNLRLAARCALEVARPYLEAAW